MRALISFTLQRSLRTNMRRTQLLGYSLQPAGSGQPAGFISTCFYSSKICPMYLICQCLPIRHEQYVRYDLEISEKFHDRQIHGINRKIRHQPCVTTQVKIDRPVRTRYFDAQNPL